MPELIHADIFFLVTTIVTIIIGLALLIAIVYLIQILRDLKHISRKIKEEGEEAIEDFRQWRTEVRTEGFNFSHFFTFFRKLLKKNKSRKN